MIKYLIFAIIILLNSMLVEAEELNIHVVALIANQAMLEINGERHLLRVGKSTPEGVKLLAANRVQAVLEINGEQRTFFLTDQISSQFSPPSDLPKVSLWPTDGMYFTTGNVNGYNVEFVVDTGASAVALNAATADRLGIDFNGNEQIGVRTASGVSMAYKVTLDYVKIGDIKLYNIAAVVLDGPEPSTALLGMSFLGQLDIKNQGDRLDLKQKY